MIKKIAYYIYLAVSVLFVAWAAFSYIDIVSDNTSATPKHSEYNIFSVFEEVVQ